MILPNKFFPSICSNFPKRDDNQGIIVNEANNDNIVEIITVTQMVNTELVNTNMISTLDTMHSTEKVLLM